MSFDWDKWNSLIDGRGYVAMTPSTAEDFIKQCLPFPAAVLVGQVWDIDGQLVVIANVNQDKWDGITLDNWANRYFGPTSPQELRTLLQECNATFTGKTLKDFLK